MIIHHMGETIDHARLIQHYRHMAHMDPSYAPFWRMRCRAVIQAVREMIGDQSNIEAIRRAA